MNHEAPSLTLPPDSPLVTAQWLADHGDHPQLLIIDCRFRLADPHWGEQAYQESHIPGAHYLHLDRDLSAPLAQFGGRHPLPSGDRWQGTMEKLGVRRQETRVILYDDFRGAFACRLWWLLRYFGHDEVRILDGGWQGWQQGQLPTTAQIPIATSGSFTPNPRHGWLVPHGEMANHSRNAQRSPLLLDSRTPERYRGEQEPIDPVAGHIPGAKNASWLAATNAEGYFKNQTEQQARWHGYDPQREIIIYCGSGVTACVNWLSLEWAGFSKIRLYGGGWSDWCAHGGPVARSVEGDRLGH